MTRPETLREARRADRISRRSVALAEAVDTRNWAEGRVAKLVTDLRRDGVSWAAIARQLGVSKQAAQQRFDKDS